LSSLSSEQRVVSGMRPTGRLHLGHYHGVLKNWLTLQYQYECFFFVADWHALTTHYENSENILQNIYEMVIDWLAVGINPSSAHLFIQSQVPEHAELALLLGMITPLGWLERVPTYKDQQEKLKEKDLATYGFLGYPLLQSADILMYRAGLVPVGEDQVAHIELTREIARRFNHIYGREPGYEQDAELAITKMGKKNAQSFHELRKKYLEQGDAVALKTAKALLEAQVNLNTEARELLFGYLEGGGKIILPEPEALLTPSSKLIGIDGQKMSKSYNNTIGLREEPAEIERKIRTMPTDPARVRRTDPGEPTKCPVWNLHQVYSSDEVKQWVQTGCRSAGIGCLECKQPVINSIQAELAPIREKAQELSAKPSVVKNILAEGAEKARDAAEDTMAEVREAMNLKI
jgi:tryptophanyl-tRNA synthetase